MKVPRRVGRTIVTAWHCTGTTTTLACLACVSAFWRVQANCGDLVPSTCNNFATLQAIARKSSENQNRRNTHPSDEKRAERKATVLLPRLALLQIFCTSDRSRGFRRWRGTLVRSEAKRRRKTSHGLCRRVLSPLVRLTRRRLSCCRRRLRLLSHVLSPTSIEGATHRTVRAACVPRAKARRRHTATGAR